MLEFPRWKLVLIALIVLVSAFYAMPNVYPQDPAVQVAANRGSVVDDELATQVRTLLEAQKVPYKSVAIEGKYLMVRLTDSEQQVRASNIIRPALSGHTTALSRASTVPAWYATLMAKPMTLGLDLQGGVHFLMQVDQTEAREKRETGYVTEMQTILRDADIDYTGVTRDAQGFRIQLARVEDRPKAATTLRLKLPGFTFADASDGSIRGTMSDALLASIGTDAIDQNITTLRNRVASLAEPVIQRQGSSQIIVEMPGITDVAEAKRLIGGTATLEWRAVVGTEIDWLAARDSGVMLPNSRLFYQRQLGADGKPMPVLLSNLVIVSGEHLLDARPEQDPETRQPAVSVRLDSAGGNRMQKHTLQNVNKPMAIVYINLTPDTHTGPDGKEVRSVRKDQEVISIATIRSPFGSNFQTTGLEAEEARELSKQLKAGALAAPMEFVEERVVGPSLGAENIKNGIRAVLFSFVFVMIFFVVYYKMFGIITNLALLLNLLLVVALMSVFGATLTLPGFAGIALTVGMSVDANVLINERIREELRLGLGPLKSIAEGYDRASGTIADANVTALLGGMAMAAFGTGPIRGFGITLIIGILTSMFTAVTVSRGIATLIYGRRRKLTTLSI